MPWGTWVSSRVGGQKAGHHDPIKTTVRYRAGPRGAGAHAGAAGAGAQLVEDSSLAGAVQLVTGPSSTAMS